MMNIQKGLVKDQGYPDVVCSYGTCDNGEVYYFIENGVLSNGNIIASNNLKEAIGHAQNNCLGLINSQGDVLIPFENRSIKVVAGDLLLVERANPVSENVVLAMKDRVDPLAANKLVTTSANVKDRMNAKIGRDGKFLYNNQFGEASVYDYSGNCLLDGYYSYIASDDEIIYCGKNIIDDPILEFPIKKLDNNKSDDTNEEVNPSIKLDVRDTGVVKSDIDQEIENETKVSEDVGNNSLANDQVVPVEVTNPIDNQDNTVSDVQSNSSNNDNLSDDNTSSNQDDLSVSVPDSENSNVVSNVKQDDIVENKNDNIKLPDISFNGSMTSPSSDLDVASDINNLKQTLKPFTPDVKVNDVFDSQENKIDFQSFKKDHIEKDRFSNLVENKYEPDTVIENANNVMKQLIKQNKNQRDIIDSQDSKIESLESENQTLISQCEDLSDKNSDLERKISRYEDIVKKYAGKISQLSEKVETQSDTIKSQQKRLDILEPQIAGRNQLGNTLEEAMEILNDSDEIDRVYTKDFVA